MKAFKMNRNSLFLFLSALLTISFWLSLNFSIGSKPTQLKELELKQIELNEQFISAKILAEKLDQVYTLFSRNLALSLEDSLAEDASLPFLKEITNLMNKNNIALLKIRPRGRDKKENYYVAPYELTIKCTYENLGNFLAEMERSPRLITVDEFSINNGIERIKSTVKEEDLLEQEITLKISTLTLIKSKVKLLS